MNLKIATLASGSKGNCTYIESKSSKILIDVGISGKMVDIELNKIGVTGDQLDAIFVTHEHIDHKSGVGVLSRKYNLPIYATRGTWKGIGNSIGKISDENIYIINSDQEIVIKDMCISPFDIPHDTYEPVAYNVFSENSKFTIATDMGYITQKTLDKLKNSDAVVLESNHDVQMLKNGSYSPSLKARILGKTGHISNETAGKLLAVLTNEKLKFVTLAHLSDENNTPNIAYKTVTDILKNYGLDGAVDLGVANKNGIGRVIEI